MHTAPAPKAKRTNEAFEVNARKRFSNNWQFLASAVWSKLEGNYDGTFQASTGQLDPNINSAFDYADFLVNADGKLSNDRVFQFKFDGSYEFSKGGIDRPEPRAVNTRLLGSAVERLWVFAGVSELGVLPRAERIGGPWSEGLGNGPAGTLPDQAVRSEGGWCSRRTSSTCSIGRQSRCWTSDIT